MPLDTAAFRDKVHGMLALGAYGDALGALHEGAGLGGAITTPNSELPTVTTTGGQAWGFWCPATDERGVPTDDTAYRLAILERWLEETNAFGDEEDLRRWMDEVSKDHTGDATWLIETRRDQLEDWLVMYAAQPDEGRLFYRPGLPVVFGLFQYLEAAVVLAGSDSRAVYARFRDFAAMDQAYGKEVTGVAASLVADAVVVDRPDYPFGDWFLHEAQSRLEWFRAHAHGDQRDHLELLSEQTAKMVEFGSGNADAGERRFLQRFKDRVYERGDLPFAHGMKNFDPLLFWMQIVSAVAYSRGDTMKALRLLAAGVGDSDTVPSMLGLLAGPFYGRETLARLNSSGVSLADQLELVEGLIARKFGVDLRTRADLYARLR